LANPVEGAYNILYSKWYTHTPINEDWELRFTDLEILSHSLVFASEDFENE
jgi:hypothetical protein